MLNSYFLEYSFFIPAYVLLFLVISKLIYKIAIFTLSTTHGHSLLMKANELKWNVFREKIYNNPLSTEAAKNIADADGANLAFVSMFAWLPTALYFFSCYQLIKLIFIATNYKNPEIWKNNKYVFCQFLLLTFIVPVSFVCHLPIIS